MRPTPRLLLAAFALSVAMALSASPAMAAPENDAFASAQQLDGNRGQVWANLSDATNEAEEPLTGGSDDGTVWFKYSPVTTGFATFSTCVAEESEAISGANITVFSGSTLATLSELTDSSGDCPAGQFNAATATQAVSAGTDYFIQIGATSDSPATAARLTYDFNVEPPANDDLAGAYEIGASAHSLNVDNGLATIEPDEPDVGTHGPRNSLWLKWTPDASGVVSIDTCSSPWSDPERSIDSTLHIYSSASEPAELSALELQATNDDGCPEPNSNLSHLYVSVTADNPYWIRIANYGVAIGFEYKLDLRWVDEPETILPPRIFPEGGRLLAGSTYLGYSYDWQAVPAVTSTVFQWERCDAAGLECAPIDGADAENYEGQPEDIGHRLRLAVTADNGVSSTTQYSLVSGLVDDPPANDNFADATDLGSSASATAAGDNYFATLEDGENNDANTPADLSVWYRWTAPDTKTYLVDSCSSQAAQNFVVNVFTGTEVGALASTNEANANCSDPLTGSQTYFAATQGAVYSIQVGSSAGADPMEFALRLGEVPAPSFASGPTLSGNARANSTLTVDSSAESSPIPVTRGIVWSLCDATGDACSDLAELTTTAATLDESMAGKRIRATVTYTNSNGSASESVLSDVIESDQPVTDPPVTSPPVNGPVPITPVDPFPQPNIAKSLGKVKLSKKNSITLSKLSLTCGPTATGDCTGTITFTTAKFKKAGKTVKPVKNVAKLRIRPGKTLPPTFKLSSSMVKAIRAAKSLKTSIAIKLGAPSFSTKTVATGVTVSLK